MCDAERGGKGDGFAKSSLCLSYNRFRLRTFKRLSLSLEPLSLAFLDSIDLGRERERLERNRARVRMFFIFFIFLLNWNVTLSLHSNLSLCANVQFLRRQNNNR